MKKIMKHKLLNGCMVAAVALTTTLTPFVANASTSSTSGVSSSVSRIGGLDQYDTAALMAEKGWTGTCNSVVLASGMNYALVDALAAGPLATNLKAPILLTNNGETLNSRAKDELIRLKPQKVYITSGTAVIKQSVLDEIKAMGITPVQLGGYDQYETSVNIAKEMAKQGADISRVVVAAGWLSPADALSVAPIAAAQGMPILTTTQNNLPSVVSSYLDSVKSQITNSYVVGGSVVVSDSVKNVLPGKSTRFSGQTKYDTNVQILKGLAKDYTNKKVYFANGETLVDALAGVPLAAETQSPVVLVNQQIDSSTKDFVKLFMSTADMVALGGEAVVPSSGLSSLSSMVSYGTDNAKEGSTDTAKPAELTDNVLITGNNVTLQNAKADYSVYVKGNNITLKNLTVKGTVFVDPGDKGTATLDSVTAANIVILSGASDSIHLTNTSADTLSVDSDSSDVHVEATGTSKFGNTIVRTYAIIDANGNSMGNVTITSSPGETPVVELRGTFNQPVVVEGQVSLKAAAGAVVSSVIVNTPSPNQKVTFNGKFKAIDVQSPAKVDLAANTVIESMKTSAKADITIPSSSSIGSLESGSTGTLVSGGGNVNGKPTTSTPSAPPSSTGGTSGGSSGGGGGGGNSGPTDSTKIVSFDILNGTSELTSSTVNGTSGNANLVGFTNNDQRITSIKITANPADSTLALTSLTSPSIGTLSFTNKTFSLSNPITMADLLGNAISGGDVSLGTLRALFGDTVTFNGTLSKSGYAASSVSLTLKLGSSTTTVLNNDWATMDVNSSTHVITANIKAGKESTKLSTMGINNLLMTSVGTLPTSVSTDGSQWFSPITQSQQIKDAIAALAGSTSWDSATLSQLVNKSIFFKDQSSVTWTLTCR
ncbi:cell wall-binding repeat-containing protein [Desulfosporosinus sp. SYSU MS00001]|uniref:cell wall-binding repeat-containing protein n=1 Tax=Desulfosporosinus sp. SYSU MS00001 TaxID=3416284 RepID=UPI003CE92E63